MSGGELFGYSLKILLVFFNAKTASLKDNLKKI
jgi:hypothetical protein